MRYRTTILLAVALAAGCDATAPNGDETAHTEILAMMEAPDTMRSLRSLVGLSSNADEAFWLYGYGPGGPGWEHLSTGTHNTIQPSPDCVFPAQHTRADAPDGLASWKSFAECARQRTSCTLVGMWRAYPIGEWKGVSGTKKTEAVWPFDNLYTLEKVGVSCPWEKPEPLEPWLVADEECYVNNGDRVSDWRRFRTCRARYAECPTVTWFGVWIQDGVTWNGTPVPGGAIWTEHGRSVNCEFGRPTTQP